MDTAREYFTIQPHDTLASVSANAEACLKRESFIETGAGTLHPAPEALRWFKAHLINLCAHARRDNGQPTAQGLLQATEHADLLLATWGLQDGPTLVSAEKLALLAAMRFGKGRKHTRYGDARWSAPAREEALLKDYGFEKNVPESLKQFLDFMIGNGICGAMHRKPVTFGCHEAVRYRVESKTGHRGIDLHDEIKTILLKGSIWPMSTPIFVALHMPADKYADMRRVHKALAENHLADLVFPPTQPIDPEAAYELGLAAGRLNIISLGKAAHDRAQPLMQICDDALLSVGQKSAYTNTGCNTWGVELLDVPRLIRVLKEHSPSLRLSGQDVRVPAIVIAAITS